MHQMNRDGARFVIPPFIDPLDPNQDPVIQQGFADVGTAIAAKLTAAGKTGVATRILFEYKEPYPPEYVGGHGELGLAALREFVEAGGTLVALDSSCEAVIKSFWLPVRNVLEGVERTDFYCPGSLPRILVDARHPLGYGLRREETALFINSPAFELAAAHEGTVVARYPLSDPNLSGWILGAPRLAGAAALLELPLGEGRVILVGFRPQFRAQTRGAYKVLFNAIYRGGLRPISPAPAVTA